MHTHGPSAHATCVHWIRQASVVGLQRRDAMDVATTAGLTDLKFRLVREDFADAVAWVARILPSRPLNPVLAGVLLTGSDDGLTISGYDYEVSAEVRVAAEIASPGSVLVSGKLLSDITRALQIGRAHV